MCKLIKDDVAATTYKWFETQLGNFIDRLNIASDMARVLAVRRAMRIKKLGAFLLSGLSLFVVASSICFFLFFYVEADREPFSSKIKTAAYWDFSTHNLTGFLVWEAVITAVACIAGVIASKEVKQPTDVEIDWYEYIITKKALLKKK